MRIFCFWTFILDITALREELGQFEKVGRERYELTWAGKQSAKKLSQTDIPGRTLKYVPQDSKNADTQDAWPSSGGTPRLGTENLYIEGDNLEVLKLLRQNYYMSRKYALLCHGLLKRMTRNTQSKMRLLQDRSFNRVSRHIKTT